MDIRKWGWGSVYKKDVPILHEYMYRHNFKPGRICPDVNRRLLSIL